MLGAGRQDFQSQGGALRASSMDDTPATDAAPCADIAPAADDAFQQLRSALLADEHHRLDRIEQRLDDGGVRAAEVSSVLPTAVAAARPEELSLALDDAVGRCIAKSVQGSPDFYANALFPIMGPSIRRAITATLRGMVQSISQTLDASFAPRSIGWRWTAWRTGVPFHELVLRNTLAYRVEQIFLVQPESGLLIQHVHRPDTDTAESDAVSAMLTAIQDFVADSFLQDNSGQKLDSIEFGEYNIWLNYAPKAVMAAVVRGFPAQTLREQFFDALERIHRLFAKQLDDFDGDRERTQVMIPILEECLKEELREVKPAGIPAATKLTFASVALSLVGGLSYVAYGEYELDKRISAYEQVLHAEPGLTLIELAADGGGLRVRGLRDPLAPEPTAMGAEYGFREDSNMASEWSPYQALHPALIEKRATALLSPPKSVRLTLVDSVLRLQGTATADWLARARLLALSLPGINRVDTSQLADDDAQFAQTMRRLLNAPATVTVRIEGRTVQLRGAAPAAWILHLNSVRQAAPEVEYLDVRDVVIDAASIAAAQSVLSANEVYFGAGTEVVSESAGLDRVADEISTLLSVTRVVGRSVRVRVLGSTDGTGTRSSNVSLALDRARAVIALLAERGVPKPVMEAEVDNVGAGGTQEDASRRKASFELSVTR
ncbi:MAG: OmpA family protein [Gammaproteobacteria bacterium]|nr:OmpA family protein [Gammaproteobacteria bacterium]